jgi:hypothetical protein
MYLRVCMNIGSRMPYVSDLNLDSTPLYTQLLYDITEGAEVKPCKHSYTRIKPLPLTFGQQPRPLHNRYTRTDTFFRWRMAVTYSRHKFVTVSLLKRLHNGRFTSETAVRRFQK